MRIKFSLIPIALIILINACQEKESDNRSEWGEYLGGPDRNHYSSLDQIDLSNVKNLKVAWEYHAGDSGQVQCNPIIVDGVLYAMTATVQPFALDAATGKEIWRVRDSTKTTWYGTSRGVAYWSDKDDRRILFTKENWLYAVDAKTGAAIESFGERGRTSLLSGLDSTARGKFVISNTPGTVFQDLIIMPLRVDEGPGGAAGFIQAFNIRTGKVQWVFKTIPSVGEFGYDTWPKDFEKTTVIGGANNWAGMAIDRERGVVYVPTGSAAFDFYGGNRLGANLFANTLLALDAKTGERKWHYQFVHHDILDRDAPAPPNLVTITRDGKKIDAVAQVTKQGFVFVFDRDTGEPIFPIKEVPVPASDIPGEVASPTQPIPDIPVPYARQNLTEDDINPTASNKDELLAKLKAARSEGPFTPLSKNGTIIFPGLDGGAEWGGAAVDPDGIMYVNSSEMPWLISLNEAKAPEETLTPGAQLYASKCSSCHGAERKGNVASGFPSLVDIGKRSQREHVLKIITSGKGMMPAFKVLTAEEQKSLIAFLFNEKEDVKALKEPGFGKDQIKKLDYMISGYTKFLDKDGYPAVRPPWGTLNAIDLNSGEYVWKKVFGEYPELMAKGIPQTGAESYGGPVITASGLLFIAGTKDGKFRAYNKKTGELVWETKLPAAAFATPATYEVNGKQFVVVACGGTKLGAKKGDSYVAFALE
jgi:quinoprotein glucose dehydrogenase